jgi:hypothetical protein
MGFRFCANVAGTASSTLNANTAAEIRAETRIEMCIILLEECGYTHHLRGVRVEEEETGSSVSPFTPFRYNLKNFCQVCRMSLNLLVHAANRAR